MTKINPDALKEWADAVMTRLPAGNPAHGLAEDAISRAFEDSPADSDADQAPVTQGQLGAGADQPVSATSSEEAKWLPRSEPPAPANGGDSDPSGPPADPVQRRNWLQRELDKLGGK